MHRSRSPRVWWKNLGRLIGLNLVILVPVLVVAGPVVGAPRFALVLGGLSCGTIRRLAGPARARPPWSVSR